MVLTIQELYFTAWTNEELANLRIYPVAENPPEYDPFKKVSGHSFVKKKGKWQQVWNVTNFSPEEKAETLSSLRKNSENRINQNAENARRNFITSGSGQAMVYQAKEAEAQALLAGGEIGPHISAESKLKGLSPQELAKAIIARAKVWKEISAQIELVRMEAKAKLAQLSDPIKISEFPESLNWPKPE